MRCCTTSAFAAGALFGILASHSFAQAPRDLQHVAPPTVGWPTNGGDWYNRRYSPLTQIDRTNVAKLKGVWRARLGGSGVGPQYSGEAQPLVVDGIVYVSTGANDVFAIGVDTGTTLWDYHANLDPNNKSVCCSWTNRGVAAGGGRVFIGQLDGKLVALDANNGKIAWSTQAEKPQDGFTITAAPLYYDGLVIVGFAGAELGVRGRVKAFDARDGKLEWTFYTIPGRGERRQRHLAAGQRDLAARRRHRVADTRRRSRARPDLLLDRQPRARLQRRDPQGRQPVYVVDHGARCEDRQIPLALPAGASRSLGLRQREPRRVVRYHARRQAA